jgi:hypothetical protein
MGGYGAKAQNHVELLLAYPSAKADGNNCETKLGYNCSWLQPTVEGLK